MALLLALILVGKAQTPLFSEGFEDGIPDEWTNIDGDGDGYLWIGENSGFSAHTGNYCASSESYTHDDGGTILYPSNWLITPAINIPAAGIYELTFWVCAQDASYPNEHYGLFVGTDATDTTTFDMVFEETINANGGSRTQGNWKQKRASLQAYAGQTIYIAFKHFNCHDEFVLNLDDVNIDLLSTDPMVTTNTSTVQFSADLVGSDFGIKKFNVSGINLTQNVTISLPTGTPFAIASTDDSIQVNTMTITPVSGSFSKNVLVYFNPTAVNYYETNVIITSEVDTQYVTLKGLAVDCSQHQTIPWYEDFSSTVDSTFPPACWSMLSTDTSDYVGSNGTVYPGRKYYTWSNHNGTSYATVVGDTSQVQDEHLYTPTFDLRNVEGALDFAFTFTTHPGYDAFLNGQVTLKVKMSTDGGNSYTTVWNAHDNIDKLTEIAAGWDTELPVAINLDNYKMDNVKFDFVYEGEAHVAGQMIIKNIRFDNYFEPSLTAVCADTLDFFTYIGHAEPMVIPVVGRNLMDTITIAVEAPFEISMDNGVSYDTLLQLPATGGDILLRFNPTTPTISSTTLTIRNTYTDATHTYADTNFAINIFLTGDSYDCSGLVLPITQDFESAEDSVTAPNTTEYCWSAIKANTEDTQNEIVNSNDYAYTGNQSFRFSSNNYNSQQIYDQYLITPELDANNTMLVMFYYANASALKDETFRVGYSTTGKAIEDFTWEDDITNQANTDWHLYRNVNVPADVKYVAIHYKSQRMAYLYIDNFQIMETPSCLFPVNLKAVNTGTDHADLTWERGANESSWQMAYSVAPLDLTSATPVPVTTLGTTINNLTSNTHYQVALRAVCNDNTYSNWSETLDFWTTTTPATLPYVQTFEDDNADRGNWVLVNGDQHNHFMFGTIIGSTTGKSLMITQNDSTNTYLQAIGDNMTSHYSTVWAYRDFYFSDETDAGYLITFKWKCMGEVDFDFGELFIGNATEVTNFDRNDSHPGYVNVETTHYTPAGLTKLGRYQNAHNTKSATYIIPAEGNAGQVKRLYFLWTNDSLSGSEAPLSIDDFKIRIPQFANISGTVIDVLTNEPVANATIYFENSDGLTATTTSAEDGTYSISNLVTGYYNITVTANGYQVLNDGYSLAEGNNNYNLELIVEDCTIIPTNVQYSFEDGNLILTWTEHTDQTISQAPNATGYYITGASSSGISYDFGCFHMFPSSDLTAVNGSRITSVSIWVYGDPVYCDYSIAIYTGGDAEGPAQAAGEPAYIQAIPAENIITSNWMTITLDEPFLIDGSQNLWVGYKGHAHNTPENYHPIIYDQQVTNPGYSDKLLWFNDWEDFERDLLVKAFVQAPDLSYNVLSDGILIASNIEEASYVVPSYEPDACYKVQTVCENGQISSPSDCAIANAINSTSSNATFEVYPNPAHETVTVSTTMNAQKVEVLNYLGQVIYSHNVSNNNFTLNVANYADGIYFIRLTGSEGIATQKLIKK